jgi:hypothetical protein
MCISDVVTVTSISGGTAIVSNNRLVRLGPLTGKVAIGDHLEVYADIALTKVTKKNSSAIHAARRRLYVA